MAKLYRLTLPNFDATPKNVVLGDMLPTIETKTLVSRKVYLISEPATGGAVFPAEGHVRSPDAYGPSGGDFVGTETLPVEADVKKDVKYGENGTEFTGTLEAGARTANPNYLIGVS